MVQRLTRLIITLLVWLLIISVGMHQLLCRVTSHSGLVRHDPPRSNLLLGTAVTVLAALFGVGVVVRLIRGADPHAARERQARERTIRQRVRRPAEGVPPIDRRFEADDDPDPAVGDEQGDER